MDNNINKIKGGLGDNLNPKEVNQKELEMGVEVEMEHTNDRELAMEIALDHLAEDPNYYSKLKKIETPKKERKRKILFSYSDLENKNVFFHPRRNDRSGGFDLNDVSQYINPSYGVGFYFTNNYNLARIEARHGQIIICNIHMTRFVPQNEKPKKEIIMHLIQNAPNKLFYLEDFDVRPNLAFRKALEYYESMEIALDCYNEIYVKFYPKETKSFIKNISKFYDGYKLQKNDYTDLILYRPELAKIINSIDLKD